MAQTTPFSPSLNATPLRYSRDTKRLYSRGVDFNDPIDSIKDSYYPILENLRSYTDGVLQPRQGLTAINSAITSQTPVHSIKRLNNKINSNFTRIVGSGTKLATGPSTSFTNTKYNSVDVAFSGNPLAMVSWRPDQSPASWMYIADSTAMYKVNYVGGGSVTTHKIGIAPPTNAPTVELSAPIWTFVNEFAATTHWANDGVVAGATSTQGRINTTTVKVLSDNGATSRWVCIVPASMSNIGPGTRVDATTAGPTVESLLISEVYRGSSATTIASILYDNSPTNTGNCTIVPTAPLDEIKRNSVVILNADTTNGYTRITEVISGVNNMVAFRCNTGATTFSATQTLQVKGSFRSYSTSLFTSGGGDVILSESGGAGLGSIRSTFTAAGANVKGFITVTPVTPIDFTKMSLYTPSASTAITDFDYYHLSFKAADLSQFVQGRIMFDCGDGSFNQNFFYRAFTPSDLVASAKSTQTVLTTTNQQLQNSLVTKNPTLRTNPDPSDRKSIAARGGSGDRTNIGDSSEFGNQGDFGPIPLIDPSDVIPKNPRDQTGTGDNQWSEIRFRRGECSRVGTDWSKGWSSINAIRFELTLVTGGSVIVEFSSLTIFGGYTPDIGDIGFPYLFRYRYRCSTTGAASNWSPATRSGVLAQRSNIDLTFTAASSLPEVDLIDIQRWGGLVTAWANVGTTLNSSAAFTNSSDDEFAQSALPDSEGQVNYQPWISSQIPKTGTASIVSGTLIKDNATNFNLSWINGTGIKIGGLETTIRRVISTSLLEVDNCVGQGASLDWEIPEPFIQVNLPCLWGPINGWFFACGDATNPGRLYFSNQNNPDSTGGPTNSSPEAIANNQGESWLDVTSPSEPLQNGLAYNGRNYVFSSEKLYEIVEISVGQFIARETPAGKGLLYRWAFTVGPKIWFLAKDGLYETEGGAAQSITAEELYPFFPLEGHLGSLTNGFYPPNMTTGNLTISGITADASTFFKLSYYDNFVYFIYPDTNNKIRCLTRQLGVPNSTSSGGPTGWYPDVYNPGGNNTGIFTIYGEEGDGVHSILMGGAEATTAKLYSYGGSDDAGTAIPWHFRQASWDAGDRRADKVFADFIVDSDPGGSTINVAAGINNYSSTITISPTTITGSGRVQTTFDINSGNGAEGKNIALDLSGTGIVSKLYLLEHAFTLRPEDSFLRATQYDDSGYEGEKFFQGIEIEADTKNIARTVQVQYDGGTLGDTLTIQHNGRLQKPYSFSSAFVAHMARLLPTDSNLWKLFRWRWISEPEPPLVTVWETQATSHGHVGFTHLKAIWITHTSTADLTLTITRMDDNTSKSFTIPNSAGVRTKETYLLLGPPEFCKGKTYKYKITQATNTPFRVYQRNCGVLVKPWGSAQAYARWVGWGADHGDGVAQI